MRKLALTAAAFVATALVAGPAAAVTGPILSINLFSQDSSNNCEDTIGGSQCSPIGVTLAGGLSNPFLNNTGNKAISLAPGSYYLFGNPYAPSDFMTQGDPISIFIRLATGNPALGESYLLIGNSTVPDLSVAGQTLFNFASYGVKITTTGITNADRMSFGYPPTAFAADGQADYVLKLDYVIPGTAVPEPATWALMLGGFGLAGAALRRKAGQGRAA